MLKAYEYVEYSHSDGKPKRFWDRGLRDREKELSKAFSMNRLNREMCVCPVCGEKRLKVFFQKWGVPYHRCDNCHSVSAGVDAQNMVEYRTYPALRELRLSKEYQNSIGALRENQWKEQLDWLSFRCYRYLGRNSGLRVFDYGNRYQAYAQLIGESGLCGDYKLKRSILSEADAEECGKADVILCMDYLQQEDRPKAFLEKIGNELKSDGLLILSTRVGSGFDILSLRENNPNVFPYEHIMLPSKEGLKILLKETGYELLEMTTPGAMDVYYVWENREGLDEREHFLRYLMETAGPIELADFQRFLQKSGMSSYAQVIARKAGRSTERPMQTEGEGSVS